MAKFNRRDLLRYMGAGSTLSFMPNWESLVLAQTDGAAKPRAVIKLQMYAGWDIAMSCDPPQAKYHERTDTSGSALAVNINFPAGLNIDKGGFNNGNNAFASVQQVKGMEAIVKPKVPFFNQPSAGLKMHKNSRALAPLASGTTFTANDFVDISGAVGRNSDLPFKKMSADPGWTKIDSSQNPHIALGPLMHQFFEEVDDKNGTGKMAGKRYLDYMTIINGVDNYLNVDHVGGSVISATGKFAIGGNNEVLLTGNGFGASIDAIFAQELNPAFVPALTFNYGALRRAYCATSSLTPNVQLFDVDSLSGLDAVTNIAVPNNLDKTELKKLLQKLAQPKSGQAASVNAYQTLKGIGDKDFSLGLGDFDAQEREAFNGMIEIVYNKQDCDVGNNVFPNLRFVSKSAASGVVTDINDETRNPNDIRFDLDKDRKSSWQCNLAAAAKMVRKGYSRGISVSFGGHNNFIPDTHFNNDHVQMVYQGQFWDGVRRMINYLIWNNDEQGRPLIETTLVIVTADIIRGPVFFDSSASGKSDYRNNSVVLIGGGLNHTTQANGSTYKGRIIGYSHGPYDSGRINFDTGANEPVPANLDANPEKKITYANIYASLLECYGLNKDKYFKRDEKLNIDIATIRPLAKNRSGVR